MKKLKFLIPILSLGMFISCNDYLDINANPNKALYGSLTPGELLSAAQTDIYRNQAQNVNELGNVYMNSWATNVAQVGGAFNNEYQLTLNNTFYAAIWNSLYIGMNNLHQITIYPNPTGVYDNYVAAALITKANNMQTIVDLYGDAPYSNAFLGQANLTPTYDDDFEIYKSLIADLEKAKSIIDAANPNAEDISGSDVMLSGVMSDWRKFANTIELRMLLRMSNTTLAPAIAYRTSQLVVLNADIAASGSFLSSDVSINPGYSTAADDKLNPFYAFTSYNAALTAAVFNNGFLAPSGHAYKSLSTYASYATCPSSATTVDGASFSYPNVADPRRPRIFRNGASATGLRATTQGSIIVDVWSVATGAAGRVNGNGLLNPYLLKPLTYADYATANGYVLSKSESYFIQAEAALRGYIPGGLPAATTLYNNAIDASFDFLGIASSSSAYKGLIGSKLHYSMTAGTTLPERVEGLMYQKWVALMGLHGIESFIDYNRTGYPFTPLPLGTLQHTNKPYRLIYPASEYTANSANVPAISENDCFTVNATTPFWKQ